MYRRVIQLSVWLSSLLSVTNLIYDMESRAAVRENRIQRLRGFVHYTALTFPQVCSVEMLTKACQAFKNQICVPCTACRYCCDDCPKKINIPACLEIYNGYKTDGPWVLGRLNNNDGEGKTSDCIGCGACAGHCPRGIRIPEIKSELAGLSEKK